MRLGIGRRDLGFSRPVRASCCASVAAVLVVVGCEGLQNATANGDTRTISFHNTHTKENLTVTYKVNGRYSEDALGKINLVLRDWREDKPIQMDPHLIDLVWDVHRDTEATEPVWIVCGYRSPDTNAMLRRRSSGVAKFSQHTIGKAMDFYIPGVQLERLREAGLRASRGGVGYYPSSNFIHLDTGSVRHWPRMPEAQLARVMAKGPLTQVAANGPETKTAALLFKPIATLLGARDEEAEAAMHGPRGVAESPRPTAIADVRGQKSAPKIDNKTNTKPEKPTERPVAMAALPPIRPAAKPAAQPSAYELSAAVSRPVQIQPAPTRPAQAASLASRDTASANDVINERGFWQALPDAEASQAFVLAKTAVRRPAGATAELNVTGSLAPWPVPARETELALAYAPVSQPPALSRPAIAATAHTTPDTTVAVRQSKDRPTQTSSTAGANAAVMPSQRLNDPWLRAMIVAPSAGEFMSTSLMGTPDYRALSPYLRKPASSIVMTFAPDPHLGMTTGKFAGSAVVFVSTVTFSQRTASLR